MKKLNSYLHQIKLCVSGNFVSFLRRHDPQLFSILSDQTNLPIADLLVNH